MIIAQDLHKTFKTKTGAVHAVDGVSFEARDGEITGLLGPNGAGKTTTLRMLYTLMKPDAGQVLVDGLDAARDAEAVRRALGVLPDARGVYKRLTARENIAYFGELHGLSAQTIAQRTQALADALQMHDILDRQTEGFSQGQRTKTAIARALVHDPRNVILDEPTNGLDVMTTRAHARLPAAAARRGPLRDLLQPHHAGGRRAVRPHRGHRQGPGGRRRHAPTNCARRPAKPTSRTPSSRRSVRKRACTHEQRIDDVMASVWSVMRKELRDILRDRRTLVLALLMGPLLYPAADDRHRHARREPRQDAAREGAGGADGRRRARAEPGARSWPRRASRRKPAPADLDAAIARQDVDVALRIDADFAKRLARQASRRWWRSCTTARVATREIPVRACAPRSTAYGDQVGALRLLARGIDPSVTRALQRRQSRPRHAEEAKRGLVLSSILPYLLILMSFLGGAYLIIDATAGERERQSLEPLLATPATRGAIVSGKIAAACALGSAVAAADAAGVQAQRAVRAAASASMLDVRFAGDRQDAAGAAADAVHRHHAADAICRRRAKSVKEAQSHMTVADAAADDPDHRADGEPGQDAAVAVRGAVPGAEPDAAEGDARRGDRRRRCGRSTWPPASALAALLWFAAVRRYHQERLAISALSPTTFAAQRKSPACAGLFLLLRRARMPVPQPAPPCGAISSAD